MTIPVDGNGRVPTKYTMENWRLDSYNTDAAQQSKINFDSVCLSDTSGEQDLFQRELVSRIVQEVKTRHTIGDIQQIKKEIDGGIYQPDPAEIAARLMLEDVEYDKTRF